MKFATIIEDTWIYNSSKLILREMPIFADFIKSR